MCPPMQPGSPLAFSHYLMTLGFDNCYPQTEASTHTDLMWRKYQNIVIFNKKGIKSLKSL